MLDYHTRLGDQRVRPTVYLCHLGFPVLVTHAPSRDIAPPMRQDDP
jgi:hypothetical protein